MNGGWRDYGKFLGQRLVGLLEVVDSSIWDCCPNLHSIQSIKQREPDGALLVRNIS